MRRCWAWFSAPLVLVLVAPAPVASAAERGWIDTSSRSAVLGAYRAVFEKAVPDPGWTGNLSSCSAGTLSAAHRSAAFERVNWYRAMAGVQDGVVEDSTFSSAAQQAALMMAANNALSHNPPSTWKCFTTAGQTGASKSNLYLGLSGVGAVDGWVRDPGDANTAVGHRGWILEPNQNRMGFGSVPAAPGAAALYVIDDSPPTLPTRETGGFVSWPPRGYVPAPTVYPRWSLHRAGADFTSAAVSVTVDGVSVPVTVEHRGNKSATARPASTLTFVPSLPAPPVSRDAVVTVSVTAIGGTGVPGSHSWTTTIVPLTQAPVADFTGDGRTDVGIYRATTGQWMVSGGPIVTWGQTGDLPVPADYTGDGQTDVAVYRPLTGQWFIRGGNPAVVTWGQTGDLPVPADYTGDGKADVAIYRPTTGQWFVYGASPGMSMWGQAGDVPVPADYTGDGKADVAVYRPATGEWFVMGGNPGYVRWGQLGDVPLPADYTGDGKADVAIYRPTTGQWFVRGGSPGVVTWGAVGDLPVPGDYTGDGRVDVAVYRPATGQWFISGASPGLVTWGAAGDLPLPRPLVVAD